MFLGLKYGIRIFIILIYKILPFNWKNFDLRLDEQLPETYNQHV